MNAALTSMPTKPADAVRGQRATFGGAAGQYAFRLRPGTVTAANDKTVWLAARIASFYSPPPTHAASGTSSNRLRV